MFSDFHQHIRHQVPHHASPQVSQGEKKRASTFIEDKHGLLCSWLKTLYVGVTRARKRVTWRGVLVGMEMIRRGWTGFLGVGNVGRTQDAQCANMSMLNSDSI